MVIEVSGGEDLQRCIDESSPNETIRSDPACERTVESPLTVDTEGVTVTGVTLRLADRADANMVEISADDVTFENFRLDGNKAHQADDYSDSGIVVGDARNVSVRHGHIRDVDRHGILVGPTKPFDRGRESAVELSRAEWLAEMAVANVRIYDVRIDSPRRDGCSVQGVGTANVTVRDVATYGSRDRGSVEVKDGASNALVTNCYAEDGLYAVTIQDHGDYSVSDVRFIGNTARNCETLVNSQISLRGESGPDYDPELRPDNIVVVGNVGRNIGGTANSRGGSGAIYMNRIDGLIASNNLVDGSGDAGITVTRCTGATVTNNVVRDATGAAITVRDSTEVGIDHNCLVDGDGHGIECRGDEFGAENVSISGNRCFDGGIRVGDRVNNYLVTANLSAGGIDDPGSGLVGDNLDVDRSGDIPFPWRTG